VWTVPREWPGCTVIIIAGGPSVLSQDLSLLAGRRVIAINSAWKTYPQADVLFFADARWWRELDKALEYKGRVVTTSGVADPRVLRLNKVDPSPISLDPHSLALRRTSVTGAINLAVHLGAAKIVLLGVDGQLLDGTRHNHGIKYPWPLKAGCFDEHAAEFQLVAPSIPIPVINASPVSTLDVWPKMSLEQALEEHALADR
jgi:hypothetical protein